MSTFAERWRAANEGGASSGVEFDPPLGSYEVELIGGKAGTSQAGKDYALTNLKILSGVHAGEEFVHYMSLDDGWPFEINREQLLLYGVDVTSNDIADLDALAEAIRALGGTRATITIKEGKNGHKNKYVSNARQPEGRPRLPLQQQPESGAVTAGYTTPQTDVSPDEDDSLPF